MHGIVTLRKHSLMQQAAVILGAQTPVDIPLLVPDGLDCGGRHLRHQARDEGRAERAEARVWMGERLYGFSGLYGTALGFTMTGLLPGFTDVRNGRMLQADGIFFRKDY